MSVRSNPPGQDLAIVHHLPHAGPVLPLSARIGAPGWSKPHRPGQDGGLAPQPALGRTPLLVHSPENPPVG